MSSIREYINIVEAFGRRGVEPAGPSVREPLDRNVKDAVSHARKYPDAHSYASENNPIQLSHGDPQHIQDRHDQHHQRLQNQWENWREQGYISPGAAQ
jgi:hypothetical protein